MVRPSQVDDVWKYIATTAIGIILTGSMFIIRDAGKPKPVTMEELRLEMPDLVKLNNPYTLDAKEIAAHLANIDREITEISGRQEQQASDIGAIAAHDKVTMAPVKRQ